MHRGRSNPKTREGEAMLSEAYQRATAMRGIVLSALVATSLACADGTRVVNRSAAPEAAGGTVIDFEKYDVGKTPVDFTPALTGGGRTVEWVVKEDASS